MISVILYGRNDAHGYNLHRRAALSLNCIAEVLTDPDDELIFVDYNTPDELPTFIEAISDTLTERCLRLLRVLRVPEAIHQQRFAARTHLPALEPIARNVAARRANPSNRWILSTNTDMIFVPLGDRSMTEICRDLPDGFYGLPRFEIPEWLWERLPRADPRRALAEVGRLGPGLKLDEPTVSHEWIRFDAPGDCQLILRDDFLAIDGFDEDMLLGYHVDSNMSRRLLLHRGSIESLEEQLAGYHCNHNRTLTVYQGSQRVENDLQRFFFAIDAADVPAQRTTWGLPDATVEEVPLSDRVSTGSATALVEAIPPGPRVPSDAFGAPYSLTYDSGHVLPFVADVLFVSPRQATIGYVGANRVLERMLGEVVRGLGFAHPMQAAKFDDVASVDRIAENADVFVIDLGLDVSEREAAGKNEFARFPPALADALVALHRLIELERTRAEREQHPRLMVLVNTSSMFWDPYILAQFDCSYTTSHSRVRRATVKPVAERDAEAIRVDLAWANRLMRWYSRDRIGGGSLTIRPGETIELAGVEEYSGFGSGWAAPEETGIWTEGERSELELRFEGLGAGQHALMLDLAMVCLGAGDSLKVELLADGDQVVATRELTDSFGRPWRVDLPVHLLRNGEIGLTVVVDEPRSPAALGWSSDDRRLGIHIRALALEPVDRALRLGQRVEFSEGSGAERFLGDGWSWLEPAGVWTVEESASLAFRIADTALAEADLVFEVVPFVAAEHPDVEAEVWANGRQAGEYVFRHGVAPDAMRVGIAVDSKQPDGRTDLEFRLQNPARPVDLGLGSDPRRLGLFLRSLTVVEPGREAPVDPGPRTLGKLRRQVSRSLRG
jgi:hypothetical protein